MNKLLLIYGSLFMSGSPIVDAQESTVPVIKTSQETTRSFENGFTALRIEADVIEKKTPLYVLRYDDNTPYELNLNDIEFIEEESVIDLDFETKDYLPERFNPYENFFDIQSVEFIEDKNEWDLGFDTSEYLPEYFDAYTSTDEISAIYYYEEDEVNLNFDTAEYLPEGFNAYEVYINDNKMVFIDMEEMEWNFGFDTKTYLPAHFDPYANTLKVVGAINFIENEEIELGFDTATYLPKDFDPYIGSN